MTSIRITLPKRLVAEATEIAMSDGYSRDATAVIAFAEYVQSHRRRRRLKFIDRRTLFDGQAQLVAICTNPQPTNGGTTE